MWLALDFYKNINTDGNIVFISGSHRKFHRYYESYNNNNNNNKHLPNDYSILSDKSKKKLNWVCGTNIEPGDFFIFNCKTLHCFVNNEKNLELKFRFDSRIGLLSHKDRINEIFGNISKNILEIKQNMSDESEVEEDSETTAPLQVTFDKGVKLSIKY